MKILYDISILGLAHAYPKARTGLFRVVENIAEQVVSHPDCEVTFSSSRDMDMVNNAIAYLRTNPKLSDSVFSHMPYFQQRYKDLKKRHELIQKVESNNNSLFNKVSQKLQIRSVWMREQCYNLFSRELINPGDLKKTDIYHSPYHPIPEQVHRAKVKSVFLTAYDLIPVLAPQYCEKEHTEAFKGILKSITPDTWVLCISADCRNDLLNYMGNKLNPERVKVTELAASDTFYQSTDKEKNLLTRIKYRIPNGPYLLSLCTLEPRKNIESVIRAFSCIVEQENTPDLNLVLVGSKGWMFDKIFEEINANQALKDRIIITGFVPDDDLAAIYSEALLFIYPSFYEGFGLPPLEAMQCGTPVLTSNTTSLPEVVGDAGLMVPPSDLDAICDSIIMIYKQPAFRQQLVEKSLKRAHKFSWKRCGEETVAAYKASLA